MNPNENGLIYYGTNFEYLQEIDKNGVSKPRHRQEQYISVCVSGYKAILPCEHPDLVNMSRIFSQELKVATIEHGYLQYKNGYSNSVTCFQGFGPCPNDYIHTYDGLIINKNNNNKITVVISKHASKYLVKPDKCNEFEYLSLALHSFITTIYPEDITGYIVSEDNYSILNEWKKEGKIKNREVWKVNSFPKLPLKISSNYIVGY